MAGFTASLTGLTDELLSEIVEDVPREWHNDNVPKIKEHLRVLRDDASEFAEAVRRFLV
jgi:hypothetical protein